MLTSACALLVTVTTLASAAPPDLKREGSHGFPQASAKVLCDTPDLRVSVAADAEHLYVQAIVWNDGDPALGETTDGREIGDTASLLLDVDGDGQATGEVDRTYSLNPWPSMPGLHYQIVFDERGSSGLTADSKGRGAITYLEAAGGRKVRVDSFLIPLAEIGRKSGDSVRFAYWGNSPVPKLTVNSVGFTRDDGKPLWSHHLPRAQWHEVKLAAAGPAIDVQAVPEGRGTIERKAPNPPPALGAVPPPVGAKDWINWKGEAAPTLDSLKGKVVVVEFWATWCGPCVAGIPHLNELHEKHAEDGLVILSLTDQSKPHVEEFMAKKPMHYTVGTGSETADAYGVRGIPHAFVIGRDGKLAWAGHPQEPEFDKKLSEELGKK